MAKEAVFQARMDAEIKEQVEQLYQRLGSSFAEAVRIFAAQSLHDQGMPFRPSIHASTDQSGKAFGIASASANPDRLELERSAFAKAMVSKHAVD